MQIIWAFDPETHSFDSQFKALDNDFVMGKAFDNRVGCAIMVEAFKQLEKIDYCVFAVGSVQEELGLRGAGTAAYGIDPDVCLVHRSQQ